MQAAPFPSGPPSAGTGGIALPTADATRPRVAGRRLLALCLGSLGVVYGDIGTSPLYALRECFHPGHGVPLTPPNVMGVLSLVSWSLLMVISLKYLLYVMRADNRGEGGVLALMALAESSLPRRSRVRGIVILLGLFGAALLYGDGVITPAISVLSAVEGLEVAAPALEHLVVPITVFILVSLFLVQKRGTERIGAVFGPLTLVWFLVLAALGVAHIARAPAVLAALSPHFAVAFLFSHRLHGVLVLGAVFLVVTGGEALYADMGHFGLRPIRLTWFALVWPALLLNYFGQGALLLEHPDAIENPFFLLAPAWMAAPLTLLATCATVIASQAVISGAYSLTRQAMMLGYWPRMRIDHTSAHEIGQIYLPGINWMLMLGTIGLVMGFGSSSRLAAAYGIAVTTTMLITSLLAGFVARYRWGWGTMACLVLTGLLLSVEASFFSANVSKVAQGGWFALGVAVVVLTVMTTWRAGRQLLARRVQAGLVPLEDFVELMTVEPTTRVPGAAVFMTSNQGVAPPALMHNFIHNHAVHEKVLLLTVVTESSSTVDDDKRVEARSLGHGFVSVVAHYGFMESPDVLRLFARPDVPHLAIDYTTFFIGNEVVLAEGGEGMSRWRGALFAFLARNAVRPTRFFNIPTERVMEIGAQVEV
ncbi:MAG: potassium transporter Kup [Polyangiaceae bacterium]